MCEVFGIPTRFITHVAAQTTMQDTTLRGVDTVGLAADSTLIAKDSSSKRSKFLDHPIFGKNRDSLVYDVKQKMIYIHGDGAVKYDNIELQAEYTAIDTKNKMVHAKGVLVNAIEAQKTPSKNRTPSAKAPVADKVVDSSATTYIRPIFKQGDASYDVDSMKYNMDSQRAYIQGVDTKEGEGYLFGGQIKKMKDNVIHMHNGRYTTCDAECKHFYLQTTKGTVVPGKKIVFGPSYMVFEDVPLYFIGLPFGFFPQMSDRNSGFIIPEIGEEVVKGFFLRNGGYYFVINDNLDLKATAGIYTLGSWQANLASSYFKRYKFGGAFQFNYASDVIGEPGSTDYINSKNFNIMWTHSQDPKASPGSTFSASVNFSTSSYSKYNAQNMQDYVNSQTNSRVAYQKAWAGSPFTLALDGQLSQDMRDTVYAFNVPSINFNVSRINPFKRKVQVGAERWYEKISFTYNLSAQNTTGKIKEADLFKEKMFQNMQYGVKHSLPVSASFNLFQYLNITPSFNYTERWYFRKINQAWNPETEKIETVDTTRGFNRVYDYNMNLGFTTNLFGMYMLGRTKSIKIRHVMTPHFSFGFNPGFGQFYETVQTNDPNKPYIYSPYASEMYSVPNRNRSANLTFGIDNTLEMKVPSTKDTTGERKIKLIEAFNINSSYDFMADSLNLSVFSVVFRTTVAKGVTLQVNSTFDPYQVDRLGQRINKFEIQKGSLARLTQLNFSFGYGFQSQKSSNNSNQSAINNPKNNNNTQTYLNQQGEGQGDDFFSQNSAQLSQVERARMAATQYYDFDIPWSVSLNYVFSYSKSGHKVSLNNSIMMNANVNLTPKWAVSFGGGYNFVEQKLAPSTVQITRDLHCWQMSFSWIPVGFRQSWQFSIRAKSSMLSDLLKLDKNNSFYDNNYRR